ncbi:MAG TPA: serine protease, partial [Gammaproteobacteria bacterium]|nr:serine protease [Gammaproteobacteria bacterium]
MPRPGTALALGLLLTLSPPASIAAQTEKAAGERPRIGLALSGGGARGLAHVGVLKVLEENHIPVDMIAGTSAGAIIAGLYAMGLSAAEVETTILGIDWNDGFSDDAGRDYRSFRRKQDDLDILTTLHAGIDRNGVRLP